MFKGEVIRCIKREFGTYAIRESTNAECINQKIGYSSTRAFGPRVSNSGESAVPAGDFHAHVFAPIMRNPEIVMPIMTPYTNESSHAVSRGGLVGLRRGGILVGVSDDVRRGPAAGPPRPDERVCGQRRTGGRSLPRPRITTEPRI